MRNNDLPAHYSYFYIYLYIIYFSDIYISNYCKNPLSGVISRKNLGLQSPTRQATSSTVLFTLGVYETVTICRLIEAISHHSCVDIRYLQCCFHKPGEIRVSQRSLGLIHSRLFISIMYSHSSPPTHVKYP